MKVEVVMHQFTNGLMELVVMDIHGDSLHDIKSELHCEISEYLQGGYTNFRIIHGYHSGQTLKKYVRNHLKDKMRKEIKSISKINNFCQGEGDTLFIIDLKD